MAAFPVGSRREATKNDNSERCCERADPWRWICLWGLASGSCDRGLDANINDDRQVETNLQRDGNESLREPVMVGFAQKLCNDLGGESVHAPGR